MAKKRDPMLGMNARERTQYRIKQLRKKRQDEKAKQAKDREAAKGVAPSTSRNPTFGQRAAATMGSGQSFRTKSDRTKAAQDKVKITPKAKTTSSSSATKPKTKPNKDLSIPPSEKANKGTGRDGSFGTGTYGSGRPSDVKPVRNRRGRVVNKPTPVKPKARRFRVKEAKRPIRENYKTEAAFKAALRDYYASDI